MLILGEQDSVQNNVTLGNPDDVTCYIGTQPLVFSKEVAEDKGLFPIIKYIL